MIHCVYRYSIFKFTPTPEHPHFVICWVNSRPPLPNSILNTSLKDLKDWIRWTELEPADPSTEYFFL